MLETAEMRRWERLTDAMLQHAANDDPEALAQVVGLLAQVQAKLPLVAGALRGEAPDGTSYAGTWHSWADLAAALGVTRSAAAQRFAVGKVTGCRNLWHRDHIRECGACATCGASSD